MVFLGTGVLAAGCGGGSSGNGVASLGTTTTTTGPSPGQSATPASAYATALAFVSCMRTHGEPNMPEPSTSKNGPHVQLSINFNGIDPNSPQFAAANNACKHLLPNKGVPSAGTTLTAADRADYLKAVVCMRAHGFPEFPDPTFQNNNVTFQSRSPIDANSPEYKGALAICQKLIPAGLPYSSSGGP